MTGPAGPITRGRVAGLLLAVLLLAPQGPPLRAQTDEDVRTAVQDLLDDRARAVRAGDRPAFMASLDRRNSRFVAQQKRWFENLKTVDLAYYELEADWESLGDLATDSLRSRYEGAEVALPVTLERYRIARFDKRPVEQNQYLTLVRRGDRWLVASDSDVADVGLITDRSPWDFGPLQSIRSKHFTLLQHPCDSGGCPSLGRDLLALAEQALERVDARWKVPWPHRVVIVEPRDTADLQKLLNVTFDVSGFVAFAVSSDGSRRSPARIVVSPEALAGRSAADVTMVLSHELVHVASRPYSGPFTPLFVEEGIAEYVGRGADTGPVDSYEAVVSKPKIPPNAGFTSGTPDQVFRRYQAAHSSMRFLVRRWGFKRFLRFYKSLGAADEQAGTANYHLNRSLRKTIGLDYREFIRRWADSIGR